MDDYKGFELKKMSGRGRRLLVEWRALVERFEGDRMVDVEVAKRNSDGLPTQYRVTYNICTMCGVGRECEGGSMHDTKDSFDLRGSDIEEGEPIFANRFVMLLTLPPNYPCVDGAPQLNFVDRDGAGGVVAMPWHPNIRYYGSFRGRVCLNAMDSYTELAWCVDRVAKYLRYELYHSIQEPPFPEDLRVARWLNHNIDRIDWDKIG